MAAIAVFCESRPGRIPAFAAMAARLGGLLAARGIEVVYGGGRVGLMGILADAALAAGGSVTGVIPRALLETEVGHRGLRQLLVVETMHERKAKMAELSDAFIALPGGFGTLEELCEVLTWSQLGFHDKPCALLDVEGYFEPLVALFDRAVTEGFVHPANRALVIEERDPERLLDRLATWRMPQRPLWITAEPEVPPESADSDRGSQTL